jgi:uncharacterized OB-fold protein
MSTEPATAEKWVVQQRWDLTYNHTADDVTGHFLRTLRDEGKLLGIRCPKCERVLAPPRPICDRDFCETEGWVELGDTGTLELFTVMYLAVKGLPEPPYVLVYVRPDGADTALPGILSDVDLSDIDAALERVRVGAPVEISVKPERTGRITDITFRLASA